MNVGCRFFDAGAFSGLAEKFIIQVQGRPGNAHSINVHRGAGPSHRQEGWVSGFARHEGHYVALIKLG